MSFTCYLVNKYEYTHENKFFRKFYQSLKEKFEGVEGEHVLIGNFSCGGHNIDAVFIQSGQITIIDFKNYGGKIKFSENNPWWLESEKQPVLVSGGAVGRNPYQQLNAYRRALMDFLTLHQQEILETNHSVKWDHIGGYVLFHNAIKLVNPEDVPSKAKWFTITDNKSVLNCLIDQESKHLKLTDNEISGIVNSLNILPSNDYKNYNHKVLEDNAIPEEKAKRLESIKRFLLKSDTTLEHHQAINFLN